MGIPFWPKLRTEFIITFLFTFEFDEDTLKVLMEGFDDGVIKSSLSSKSSSVSSSSRSLLNSGLLSVGDAFESSLVDDDKSLLM